MKTDRESHGLKMRKEAARRHLKATDLHLGDSVKVLSLNLKGTVSTLPDAKGNLYVQMGILRSQVNITDLELVEESCHPPPSSIQRTSSGQDQDVQVRLR